MSYDVVIPLKSTNSEIVNNIKLLSDNPSVSKVLVGDAGIDSDILNEINKITNVVLIDQKHLTSQGTCIIDLIKNVSTEYFAYLHGDVTIPENWFQIMADNMGYSKFAECGRVYDYSIKHKEENITRVYPQSRPLSGSQFGEKSFFLEAVKDIEDDYLYRNEDLIIADLIDKQGGNYKIINETHHIHQIGYSRKNENIDGLTTVSVLNVPSNSNKDMYLFECQIRGIIKYCKPEKRYLINNVMYVVAVLKHFNKVEIIEDILNDKKTSFKWKMYIKFSSLYMFLFRLKKIIHFAKATNKEIMEK
jgi:hypothetical protein